MSATLATLVRRETSRSHSFFGAFGACWYAIARHFARRAATKRLAELSDRKLRDIGIERSQIEAAVHGFVDLSDRMRL